MQANPCKLSVYFIKTKKNCLWFQGIIRGSWYWLFGIHYCFRVCIDELLTFDKHVNNICIKAGREIGSFLICLAERQFLIVSSFQILIIAHRCVFQRVGPVLQRFINSRNVLIDSISDYETLLSKGGVDYFRISSLKTMAVEIYRILNAMDLEYLSPLFSWSTTYNLRDDNKLFKRATTYGIKSLAYYGTHL